MFLLMVQPPARTATTARTERRASIFEKGMVRKYIPRSAAQHGPKPDCPSIFTAMALPQDLLRNGPTRLRTLEPEDVDWMMRWENAPEHWQVSGTIAPYSRAALEALCQGHQDLYTAGQLRWVVEERGKPIGAVDLYEFSALHQRSGIGILIDPAPPGQRAQPAAPWPLRSRTPKPVLLLRGLHAQVHAHNGPSLASSSVSGGFDESGPVQGLDPHPRRLARRRAVPAHL